MRIEEIDEALRQQPMWQPPHGFARQVARMAQVEVDSPPRLRDALALVPYLLRNAVMNFAARVDGLRWMLHQYWVLLSH